MNFTAGLDLGKARDFSALVVAERIRVDSGEWERNRWGERVSRLVDHYHVRHIQRWPRGTRYPEVVAQVGALLGAPELRGSTKFRFDATGVGSAIEDMIQLAYRQGRCGTSYPEPITITSGRSGDNWLLVPKVDLVSQLQVLVQQQRIFIAEELPLATLLRQELLDFRVKISQAGVDTYEALTESAHDDLVTALALAVLRPHVPGDASRVGKDGAVYVR